MPPESPSPFADLIETVRRLRAPDGCPWDREQTFQSLRPYLIEEAYEVLDVLDRIPRAETLKTDPPTRDAFREELGDLLMQVMLHAQMASEAGAFDIHDVTRELNDKLVRRHPHVFGDARADSADAAYKNWEKQKAKEKAAKKSANAGGAPTSVLEGLPKNLPSLQRTARLLEKVTKVGFQWPDLQGPIEKVREETGEFLDEARALERAPDDAALRARAEAELGDLLFTVCNVAFLLKLDPEDSLRAMLRRFETRFRHVERRVHESGKTPDQTPLEEMDRYWDEAKHAEKNSTPV